MVKTSRNSVVNQSFSTSAPICRRDSLKERWSDGEKN